MTTFPDTLFSKPSIEERQRPGEIFTMFNFFAPAEEFFQSLGDDSPVTKELGLAVRAFRKEKFEQAHTHVSRALGLQPKHFESLLIMGYLQAARKEFSDSLQHFECAREQRPDAATIYAGKARTYAAMGGFSQADENFAKALSLCQRDLTIHRDHARCLIALGKVAESIDALKQALLLAPGDMDLWLDLMELLAALGGPKQALDFLTGGMALQHGENPHLLWAKARLASLLGEHEVALSALDRIESLVEDTAPTLTQIAKVRLACHDIDGALADLEKALATNANFVETHFIIGYLYEMSKNSKMAVMAYETAHKLDPSHWQSLLNLVILKLEENDPIDEIEKLFNQLVMLNEAPKENIETLREVIQGKHSHSVN